MDCNGSQSLYDWITNDNQFTLDGSLSDWLTNNLLNVSSSQIQVNATWNPNFINLTDNNSQNLGYIGNREDNPIRVPFTTTDNYGVIKVGEGLAVNNGILTAGLATTSYYGGLKLFANNDASIPANGVPLKLSNGKAYVDLSGINIENYLQDWRGADLTTVPRVYDNPTDNFGQLNLVSDFGTYFVEYFDTHALDYRRIYPIRADVEGRLYAFVDWQKTPINIFQGAAAGYVPNATTEVNKAKKYLNAYGQWTSPENTTYSVFNTTTNGLVPKSTSNTNKYLKGDGTWDTPTNTLYNADNESIFMTEDNKFYEPHQFSITTLKKGDIENAIDPTKFKKINYNVIGITSNSSELSYLGKDLTDIFEKIANLAGKNRSSTITYSCSCNDTLRWTLNDSTSPTFIRQCREGVINSMEVYGDIKVAADDITDLPSNVNELVFTIGNSGTNTHYNITFSFVEEDDKIKLTIVSTESSGVNIDPIN